MNSIYFIPLFNQKEILQNTEERVVFGFQTYEEYSRFYSQISIFTNYQILILEDFFPKPFRNSLLLSLFLLHLSFENIVIWSNGKVLKEKIEDVAKSFLGNRTVYGVLKEDVEMELEGYSLIERRIIESKMGKLDLKDIVEIYHSDDLKSFFEKNEITVKNIQKIDIWREKNLFRHYLYYLILEKRILVYSFDQKENLISFVKEQNILHTYF